MKKFLILAIVLLASTKCFADCTGKPVNIEYGEDRFTVKTEYSGSAVVDPGDQFDVKTYFAEGLINKDEQDLINLIKADIQRHCEALIFVEYNKIKGSPLEELRKEKLAQIKSIVDELPKSFNSIEETKTTAKFKIDTDGDKLYDQIWEVSEDGQKVVTDISPTADPK